MIQMLNGLGLMMTSLRIGQKPSKSRIAIVPIALLTVGTCAFSGFIFYEKINNDRTFSPYIRYGGSATIFGWLAIFFL